MANEPVPAADFQGVDIVPNPEGQPAFDDLHAAVERHGLLSQDHYRALERAVIDTRLSARNIDPVRLVKVAVERAQSDPDATALAIKDTLERVDRAMQEEARNAITRLQGIFADAIHEHQEQVKRTSRLLAKRIEAATPDDSDSE